MTFLPLTPTSPYLPLLQGWYEDSFPVEQRRDVEQLIQLLAEPAMHPCVLLNEGQPVGFVVYWQWPEFLFLEHFAIDPAQRGKSFGQQALAHLLRVQTPFVILEVERPEDEASRRRIRFYERQGFCLNPYDYAQPPYRRGHPALPMRLMSIPAIGTPEAFEAFRQFIRERVYQRFYR